MDKNAIKKFAVWARRELIARVSQKAEQYGITEEHHGDAYAERIGERLLTRTEQNQRKNLIIRIEQEGYQQVMEEAAYTWFNRFIALRFMEVNGYLPTRIRVFTDEENAFKPQILAEAIHMEMDGLDMEKVYAFKEKNQTEELFKYLIITQCNALSSILPGMFQTISDYTELLFPDNLLREGSVIQQMIELIPEEDWQDQVQIIGWLYQYYNTEPKDQVFANLKKNIKISKHDIPAATQLFTPDWIVRYMVENSLGRLWVEGHPDEALQSTWKYYLPEAEQEPDVQAQLAKIREEYATLKPEDIKCIDPCMGSGHILCYLFDVLVQIYEAYGYSTREAVQSILENNLYGLDIDDRAAQLAYFAVMMKARQYDRRFFTRGIQPHVMAIQESNTLEAFEQLQGQLSMDKLCVETANALIRTFRDAKIYGSILNVDIPGLENADRLMAQIHAINGDFELMAWLTEAEELLPVLARQAAIMQQKYDVVVTNPPYMGASNMNAKLSDFIKTNYADYKSDFFSAFVVKCSHMAKKEGFCGFFTPYVWMFIQSYEKMRQYLYTRATIETLIQFEYSAFEEATVPVCTFAFRNGHINKKGCYLRLTEFKGGMEAQRQKALEAIANHNCGFYFEQSTDNFSKIPGAPVAYWVSEKVFTSFTTGKRFLSFAKACSGLKTGNNERFTRFWHEVSIDQIGFGLSNTIEAKASGKRWFPYNKGGDGRCWYGNNDLVVDFQNDGEKIRQTAAEGISIRITSYEEYFHEGVTWTALTSSRNTFRYSKAGAIFDSNKGPMFFHKEKRLLFFLLGLFNSVVARHILNAMNPSLSLQNGDMENFPVLYKAEANVENLVESCIRMSEHDWDSFETSWDFKKHPLISYAIPEPVWGDVSYEVAWKNLSLYLTYENWKNVCENRFKKLKANEEELNRIFIDIYGLQDELTPEVEDKDVTVRRADLGRDIRSFISYAVGCMFGRYSLDVPGLILAGQPFSEKYIYASVSMAGASLCGEDSLYVQDGDCYLRDQNGAIRCTFAPDRDGILPISDDEYFDDDIVGRFVHFVETVYGGETLEENLRFIANALGGSGTPRQVIRSYFLNDFYADHLKIYQKRPIYWLFDSGKKNGFKCLIYMHRYAPDTIARIRTDYVHEQQSRYRTAIHDIENRVASASTGERVNLTKQLTKLRDQAEEARVYEEKIHHYADQMIAIDLDDGVKVNYAKFQDVLAKIK